MSSVPEDVLYAVGMAEGLIVPLVVLPMGLIIGETDGLCVIVVVRPGTLVKLSPPPREGEIVVVGATVAVPGLTGDDGIGAAVGADTGSRVAIEKDIEKLMGFDPSIAAEKNRKKLHFPRKIACEYKTWCYIC